MGIKTLTCRNPVSSFLSSDDLPIATDVAIIFTNLTNIQDSPLINALQNEKPTPINSYKGFKFEILTDNTNKTRFPKQYAVAKTPAGVIVLQSESSFTASPQVLIKELIYVIDRDDLKL